MRNVVIDNWTLERAAVSINDTYEGVGQPNEEYASLIEALILWDNISFFDNGKTYWKDTLWRFDYEKYLHSLPDPKIVDIKHPEYDGIVQRGALDYYEKCRIIGADYLAVSERAEFLSSVIENSQARIPRLEVTKRVDDELEKLYERRRNGLPSMISFDVPALFEYVRNNTADQKFYIKTAIQLHDSKAVRRFREWLANYDEVIQHCDRKREADMGRELKDIMRIINRDIDGVTIAPKATIELNLLDAILFSLSPIKIAPSIEISNISLPKLPNRQLAFLRKVVKQLI